MGMGLGGLGRLGRMGRPAPSKGVGANDPLAAIFTSIAGYYPVAPGYVFKDTAGTIPCTADGDLPKCLRAKYGGLPDLAQATDSSCAVYKDDGGGRWRADFDGLDDAYASASSVTVDAENLLVVAMLKAADVSGSVYLRDGNGGTNAHQIIGSTLGRANGQYRRAAGTSYVAASPISELPAATKLVASSLLTASQIDIANDLGAPTTAAAVVSAPITGVPLQIAPTGAGVSIWGFAVLRAASVQSADRITIIKALAALQGRTL